MAVEFTCPECGNAARIVAGGFVEAHEARGGRFCSFTRTARSGGAPKPAVERTPEQQAKLDQQRAELARITASKADEAKRDKRVVKPRTKPKAAKKSKPKFFAECTKCHGTVKVPREDYAGILPAHRRFSGHWCSGGKEPTVSQRNGGKARRSVHATSAGLPGLGKR
jgi:hypothetical protein